MALVEVGREVALILVDDLGLGLFATEAVAERSLDGDLVEDSAVVQGDGQSVGNGTLRGVMVVLGELGVLDAADALAEVLKQRRGGSLRAVSVVAGSQTAKDQHGGHHVLGLSACAIQERRRTYLDAVITVSEVVHGLELLVDDADASLVGAVGDLLDILGALAHLLELLVDDLSGLDGSLGVELGCDC